MLKPDALQNIKLSVFSANPNPNPNDKIEIKWGAKNDEGKLSDQTCKIEGNELVLPYVAWRASRGVTKVRTYVHTPHPYAPIRIIRRTPPHPFARLCTHRHTRNTPTPSTHPPLHRTLPPPRLTKGILARPATAATQSRPSGGAYASAGCDAARLDKPPRQHQPRRLA